MVESYGLEIIPTTEPGSFYQPLPAPSVTALEHRRIADIVQRARKILQPQGHLLAVVENNYLSSKQVDAWSAEMKFCQTSGGKRRHHHHPRSGQTNAGRQRPEPRRGARQSDVKPDLRQSKSGEKITEKLYLKVYPPLLLKHLGLWVAVWLGQL